MTALSFPTNPAVNDLYTAAGRTWCWSGVTWEALNTGPMGPVGPAGPSLDPSAQLAITNATASTSSTTGALTVTGGVGVGGRSTFDGYTTFNGSELMAFTDGGYTWYYPNCLLAAPEQPSTWTADWTIQCIVSQPRIKGYVSGTHPNQLGIGVLGQPVITSSSANETVASYGVVGQARRNSPNDYAATGYYPFLRGVFGLAGHSWVLPDSALTYEGVGLLSSVFASRGTITNLYGLKVLCGLGVDDTTQHAAANGFVTNYFGIHLGTPTVLNGSVITNRWGVYQEDPLASNIFYGPIRRGEVSDDLTATGTTTTTNPTVIATIPAAHYRSLKVTIQTEDVSGSNYQVDDLLAIITGSVVTTSSPNTVTAGEPPATFAFSISDGSLLITATPASADAISFKTLITAIRS